MMTRFRVTEAVKWWARRRASRVVALLLPFAFALAMPGCHFPGEPDPANRPVPANQVVDFRALYSQNCAGCHGADGKLGPAPPLNDPLFLAIVPDDEVYRVISAGRRGTLMPAFSRENGGPLTVEQVKALAEGLKLRWRPAPLVEEKTPQYLVSREGGTPPATGDTKRGGSVFMKACGTCHGMEGEGDKHGAIHDRDFLALLSDQALRRYVITGRPDLGMPPFNGKDGRSSDFAPLTAQDVADVVALMADWRKETEPVSARGQVPHEVSPRLAGLHAALASRAPVVSPARAAITRLARPQEQRGRRP